MWYVLKLEHVVPYIKIHHNKDIWYGVIHGTETLVTTRAGCFRLIIKSFKYAFVRWRGWQYLCDKRCPGEFNPWLQRGRHVKAQEGLNYYSTKTSGMNRRVCTFMKDVRKKIQEICKQRLQLIIEKKGSGSLLSEPLTAFDPTQPMFTSQGESRGELQDWMRNSIRRIPAAMHSQAKGGRARHNPATPGWITV